MQAPKLRDEDTSGGFTHGGWATPYWEDVMEQVRKEAMAVPYDLLLGRKTYDLFAANFPKLGDDHPMNNATKFVATSSGGKLEWKNSSLFRLGPIGPNPRCRTEPPHPEKQE